MRVVKQICVESATFVDGDTSFTLERGKEYITSPPDESDQVFVFSSYWFSAPGRLFAGAIPLRARQ